MLIEFKVSNSRSIGKELILSAIATDDNLLPENTIDLPKYGIKILKMMALFGANASGKSNIINAIFDADEIIGKPQFDKTSLIFPFNRNSVQNAQENIHYSFTFLMDETIFTYSFSHNKERITHESLSQNIDNENDNIIYSRTFDTSTKKYSWFPEAFFSENNTQFFRLSTAEHKLFLTIANNPANPDAVQAHHLLQKVFFWFKKQLLIAVSLENPGKLDYDYFIALILRDENNKQMLLDYLKKVNIAIENIEIFEIFDENTNGKNGKFTQYQYIKPNGEEGNVLIKTYHKSLNASGKWTLEVFDFFTEESHGTQQFLAWLGSWLYYFQINDSPIIFVIDELGASLHPKLTLALMQIFADKRINTHSAQLIFTSHEIKLMDKMVLRPDQLFLVNKDIHGDTSIERASDYAEIEKYARLDTLYMNGGMSGIPMINL